MSLVDRGSYYPIEPIEEAGQGQKLASEHPHPYDDDDEAGPWRGQERETRNYQRGPAHYVKELPVVGCFAPLAMAAMVAVTRLEAVARLDLLREAPPLYRLL